NRAALEPDGIPILLLQYSLEYRIYYHGAPVPADHQRPTNSGRRWTSMSKTAVILGAGVGGLTTAAELCKVLPAQDRIVLVDRSFTGSLGLSLLWVMRGWRTPEQVRVQPSAAALPGVEMVTAEVDRIDDAEQTVHCHHSSPIRYDALVIALG